ncbi:tRNA (adenosine(37)-N6)-threonylcarbamoyltransferase complex ATPase subunit type 1 TsaE [Litoreibacter janthinus]|uniref:tRNA threonylcarbamoyladenosine biosynthesis protein TsaE n=1 Tax=Litoreibacter janthinus TaxID=670154 RepID=A0A1I6FWA2_9RHOB|nr:tRNA (adenosine(37)-N6)-threonylcarbamoyltransferase complex ATPase subunit type 1 TsaE [Litoreibacter janthinus]SFR34191.1 tRNA threonylcarbamoyladenosine biosynthesis protein TsaE [Litoreibacter janthinus]
MTPSATASDTTGDGLQIWSTELADPDATTHLARAFSTLARSGMCILLEGPVGAGKSFFARALIQTLMAKNGGLEDVPSPTFTLVQSYELGQLDVWHADLYRLTSSDELIELGLDDAFETALCLIEWPERLGDLRPEHAIELTLTPDLHDLTLRHAQITAPVETINSLKKAMESS